MPNEILLLILVAVALLAVIDMGLGQLRPGPFGGAETTLRIGAKEFATGPLPIFLFGVGAAMLPARIGAGSALLLLAAGLALLGRRDLRQR